MIFTSATSYVYRADGLKVKKSYNGSTTDYLDGFQYQNSLLQFFPTAEGYYDKGNNRYVYNYTDHLGNVRLSYYKNSTGALSILEESNYYPFGLKHAGYNNMGANPAYNYKYNGKELQETGMYDYGARIYMPDIGRWGVQDELSEKFSSHSNYAYVGNNPIIMIDLDGRDWYYTEDGQYIYNKDLNQDNAKQFFKDNNIENASWAFEDNTMGSMHYAPDGFVYDNSEKGGGLPVENGKVHDIQGVTITKTTPITSLIKSDAWNSPIARVLVPDTINLNITNNFNFGFGVTTSMLNITILTRGDAGIFTTPTVGVNASDGGNVDLEASASTGRYTGDPRTLNASNLNGFSASGSAGIGAGPEVAVSASYAPKDPLHPFQNAIISTGVSGGIGVRAGATVASFQGGVNYTPKSGVHQILKFR